MKRSPVYDPPEYRDWAPDREVLDLYRRRVAEQPGIGRSIERLGAAGLERLYRGLVRNRLHDIALSRWVRTGVITKAWLGCGEEAATVGAAHALGERDVVGPMIRNAAATFERGMPIEESFRAYLATGDGVTKGRDLHIGDLRHGVVAPISHVGDLVPVLAGFALAFRLRGEDRVALTWTGEGATRTGAVHEGLSLAAARRLPLIVVVQDNEVALGTVRSERMRRALESLADGHGVPGLECDGNHVLDVHRAVSEARELCLAGEGPVVVLASTFRLGGHATHDEAEARRLFPPEVFAAWGKRDPIGCYEEFLKGAPHLIGARSAARSSPKPRAGEPTESAETLLARWESEVGEEVESAARRALESRESSPPDPGSMLGDVFAG